MRESGNAGSDQRQYQVTPEPPSVRAKQLRWGQFPAGRELRAGIQARLDEFLPRYPGYYLLTPDELGESLDFNDSPIRHRIRLRQDHRGNLQGDFAALPVATDSVDLAVLLFTQDFARQPRALVKEVSRCLIPHGHVILFGLNPWSLWGATAAFRQNSTRVPWQAHFISPGRMQDWLDLLGLESVHEERWLFLPPLRRQSGVHGFNWLENIGRRGWPHCGAVYMIVARKQVATLTPIKPQWQKRKAMMPGVVAGPCTKVTAERNRFEKNS